MRAEINMSFWEACFRHVIANYCPANIQGLLHGAKWEFCADSSGNINLLIQLHPSQIQEFAEGILSLTRGLAEVTTCRNIVIIPNPHLPSQLIWPVRLGNSLYSAIIQKPGDENINQGLHN